MAAESSSAKWWQTVPGILTAITATITAVAGLIAVLHQTGILPSLGDKQPQKTLEQPLASRQSTSAAAAGDSRLPVQTTVSLEPPITQVALPVGDGNMVYTLLSTQLKPYNSESRSLAFRIRAFNDYRYPTNFWDRSFRLVIDGLAQAPTNSLNEVLDAQAVKEGEIIFTIPFNTQQATLQIGDPSQASTQIALDLTAKPST